MSKKSSFSRYVHLCLAILMLYGITWVITYTTEFEKVINRFRRYCYADYQVRTSITSVMKLEAEFTRDQFAEQLHSFSASIFDYRNEEQVKEYFSKRDFFFNIRKTDEGNSYLLAPIIYSGYYYEEKIPETVAFQYAILGEEEISPFSVYQEGKWTSVLVSEQNGTVYIHTDTLYAFLRWYFALLWMLEPQTQRDFDIDGATHYLYLDLPEVCEEVFIERRIYDKETAREYFLEKAFESLYPTMLAMGARTMADKETAFSERYKYERAYLTGLAVRPQYTLFNYLATYGLCNTLTRSLADEVHRQLSIMGMREIDENSISLIAQKILAERRDSLLRDLIEDKRELPDFCYR
jgi:hypothetical protein